MKKKNTRNNMKTHKILLFRYKHDGYLRHIPDFVTA